MPELLFLGPEVLEVLLIGRDLEGHPLDDGETVSLDPGALAGGIWEALLTTAAGMGVAIPAAMAGAWFESIAERIQADMEDVATVVFTRGPAQGGGRKEVG